MSVYRNKHHKTGIYRSEYNGTVSLPDGKTPIPLGSGVIRKLIGEGGTSLVYEIWNEQLGIHRAVKLLKPTASRDSRERFGREIKILAQLNHPNIINVHAVGEWNDLPYIEMDLVDGLGLDQLVSEMGALPSQVVVAMAIFIARALDYTHSHRYKIDNVEYIGLLHRDLKPANILLPRNDILRLTDFGIASLTTTAVTQTSQNGMVTGSMQYLAPEQLDEGIVDHRSDIFSFGCVLYELLTGEKVFPEKHIAKLVKLRVQNQYIPLKKWKLKIPPSLETFVEACLSHQPQNRPNSMKDITHYLEELYKRMEPRRPEEIIRSFISGEKFESKKYTGAIRHSIHKSKNFFTTTRGFLLGLFLVSLVTGGLIFSLFQMGFIGGRTARMSGRRAEAQMTESIGNAELMERLTKKKNLSRIEMLMFQYEADTVEVLEKLDNDEKYDLLLAIIEELPMKMQIKKATRLRKHRAVVGLEKESFSYYNKSHISDGEYMYHKGRYFFNNGQYQRSIWLLRVAETTPSLIMSSKELKLGINLYMAQAETALLQKKQGDRDLLKSALEHWKFVKQGMRKETYHPNYKKAVEEITRLEGML